MARKGKSADWLRKTRLSESKGNEYSEEQNQFKCYIED